jgi:hypothetical protein
MLKRSLILLVASVALAACGSDDSDGGTSATTEETISKGEFIERGDQLCQEFNDASEPLDLEIEQAINQQDFGAAADVFDQGSALAMETLDDFEDLPVPEGEEDVISRYLDVQSQQIALAGQLGEAVRNEDTGSIQALTEEAQGLEAESDEIAEDFGFTVCGQG